MAQQLSRMLLAVAVACCAASAAEVRAQTTSAAGYGSVGGRVVDAAGLPVVSAMVSAPDLRLSAVTDERGHYLIEGVSVGRHRFEAECVGFAGEIVEGVVVIAGSTVDLEFHLKPLEVPLKEIVVTAKASILREAPAAKVALDRRQIAELPHFGDDLYRAVAVLPGVSSGDFSARFSVRGGLHDETLVVLDGQELMEPFHLKDFQGVFSILDPEMIGGVELTPGGFTAEHGDRMTGVLDMVTRAPKQTRFGIGISLTTAWANAAGLFSGGQGSWLVSARRGYLDFILNAVGDDDDDPPDPKYWDAFAKVAWAPGPSQSFSAALLAADDSIQWEEDDEDEFADINSGYGSTYLWLNHQGVLGERSFVNTALYLGDITVRRDFWVIDDIDEFFSVNDVRDHRFFGLRQQWQHELGRRHYLRWGFDLRSYDVSYDYELDAEIEDPIDDPRFYPAVRVDSFHDSYEGRQYGVFLTDRVRLGTRLTAEAGLRYDRQTLTEESEISPRLNLLCNVSSAGVVRLGWGHFHQSQRPYELRVQFGETEFLPAQRAEQVILGYETDLGAGLSLKVDAYSRTVTDPHSRWETIFDPWNPVPEIATDLSEIVPEQVNARGLELFLAGRPGGKFDWWASYAYTSIEDVIAGVDTPRYLDQPHSVTASLSWRPGPKWSLTGVLHYHTGWPTTTISTWPVQLPDGRWTIGYEVGPFYQERLDDYWRVDLRASRSTPIGRDGRLTFFIDVQNLTDRQNVRGLAVADAEWYYSAATGLIVTIPEEHWLPIIPSFGVSIEF